MGLSRNARRRLALYGSAAVVVLFVQFLPHLLPKGPAVRHRTFDASRALPHEASQLLAEYLRIDTSNPPGTGVRAAADFLGRVLACEGIPYEILGDDPDRPIFYSRMPGRSRGDGLVLLHHMDVVSPGPLEAWKVPPFSGAIGTGLDLAFLYGRGALDMKGQGVANLYAYLQLHRSGIQPLRDVIFIGEPAEETYHPEMGVGWILDHRPELLEGVRDVFNEGGLNESIGYEIQRWGINVFEKGVLILEMTAEEEQPLKQLAADFVAQNPRLPFSLVQPAREFLMFLAPSRPDYLGRLMDEPEQAFESELFRRTAPLNCLEAIKDMVYVGGPAPAPTGGFSLTVVYGILPGSDGPGYRDRALRMAAEKGVKARVEVMTPNPAPSPMEGPAWDALHECLSLDHERAPIGSYMLTVQYTHSAYLRSRGLRAYGFSPFNVSQADASTIHAANERIVLELFVEGCERMEKILREFATRP